LKSGGILKKSIPVVKKSVTIEEPFVKKQPAIVVDSMKDSIAEGEE